MWRERLTEFSDCLQLGLLVCAASIPVVTVGPAFAAGCRVVSRWRDGESPPMFATFRDEFVRRLRGGVPFSAAVVVAILLLSVDLALVEAGVPGGQFFAVLFPIMLLALLVVALRTCSVVAVHQKWIPALRAAARHSLDIRGSALLAGAIVTAGVLVWMQPLMLLLVAGPVTLAAVGTAR